MAATYDGLYTLRAAPSLVERETVDLFPCDSAGQPLHRPEIEEADPPAAYALSMHHEKPGIMSLVDPLSGSILCSTITISQNRMRCMQLHNPSANVELKNKTLMSFEWAFRWEDMRFAWQRDRETISTRNSGYMCKLSRKPDPDIVVASYVHRIGVLCVSHCLGTATNNQKRAR